jgi:hypothetical protein
LVQTQAEGQPHDRDSATQSVRRGDLTAYLLLHPGFGESLRPFGQDGTKIELGIDPSRQAEAGFLQGIMMEATFSILGQQFTDPEEMRRWLKIGQKEVEQARELPEAQKKILLEFFACSRLRAELLAARFERGPLRHSSTSSRHLRSVQRL